MYFTNKKQEYLKNKINEGATNIRELRKTINNFKRGSNLKVT
jgi:hypothetical protein